MNRFPLICLIVFLSGWLSAQSEQPISVIAFGSCAKESKPQPIWEPINAMDPDLFLFLGDNIYGDTEDMSVMREKYAKLGSIDGYRELKADTPVLATWDDHDYGVNDGGVNYPMKDESQEALLDFFEYPEDDPVREQQGIYHARLYGPKGKRVQVIMLDTRYHRSDIYRVPKADGYPPYAPNYDPDATMLGEEQWAWLEEQLRQPAELRIIGSSIQFVPEDHWFEKWANLPLERERMLNLIAETGADGVLFLSGDRHLAELSILPESAAGYPIYDLTSSGMTQGSTRRRALEENRWRAGTMNYGNNFGAVIVDWDREDPEIRLQIRDEIGDIIIQRKIPLSLLSHSRGQ